MLSGILVSGGLHDCRQMAAHWTMASWRLSRHRTLLLMQTQVGSSFMGADFEHRAITRGIYGGLMVVVEVDCHDVLGETSAARQARLL